MASRLRVAKSTSQLLSANIQIVMAAKCSYIDRTGKTVIDASRYESACGFSEGLAPVMDSRKGWGFIDRTGAFVIQPQFESALCFSDGLAAVLLHDRWGFIDKNGALVIDYQFEWVAEFSEGVAVVQRSLKPAQPRTISLADLQTARLTTITEVWDLTDTRNYEAQEQGEFLLIDTVGKILMVFDPKKVEVDIDFATFSQGLLCAYSPEKDAMGFVDKSGEFVIPATFSAAAPFSEGLARVAVIEDDMEKFAFIDKNGNLVIPPTFNTDFDFRRNSSGFSEGLAAVSEGLNPTQTEESKFVYIDRTGKIVFATEFFYAGEFRDGLAVVYNDETDRWGFIDTTGKVVIPVQYPAANDFSEGLALVSI